MLQTALDLIRSRAKEPSTWAGLIILAASSCGFVIDSETVNHLSLAAVFLVGLFETWRSEAK